MILSQSVRSIGAGLCLGAFLMVSDWSVNVFQNITHSNPLFSFGMGLRTMSTALADGINISMIFPIAWAAFCIGAGLCVAGIVVPLAEAVLGFIFRIPGEIINLIGNVIWLRRKNREAHRGGCNYGGRESEFSTE